MPLQPRARSKASQNNDARILRAGIAEAHSVGLDRVTLRAVVRRCNLSSGAIYGRYEDVDEFVAALWSERLSESLFEFLSGAMSAMLGRDAAPSIAQVARTLASPPQDLAVAFESLVIGRRNDVLGDEIAEDFAAWSRNWGLHTSTPAPKRALFVVAFTTIMGAALYSFVEPKLEDWNLVLAIIAAAIGRTSTADAGLPPAIGDDLPDIEVSPGTGEPLRDALIIATANVIGRAGYERATVSRIGRRAKLTGGAVYTRYETKDELIIDTLDTLLTDAMADTSELTEQSVRSGSFGELIGKIYSLGVVETRRPWRQFRLETYVAARTRKEPRAALRRVHSAALLRYHSMLSDRSNMSDAVIRLVARGGQSIPLGLSLLECHFSDLDQVNFHPFSASLYDILASIDDV